MAAYTTDYCKHPGGIEAYLGSIHPDAKSFFDYREKWRSKGSNLLFLLVETVSKCNLKCPMCIHSVGGYDSSPPMKDDLFSIVLKNIQDLRIPSICMNDVNEPLLDKKIISRLRQVTEIPTVVDSMMNTNAVLLTKATSSAIVNSGLHRLLIGLDAATAETYKQVRGASYDKIRRNIFNFLDAREKANSKFPVVRLSFVRTTVNEQEIEDWIDQWKSVVDYLAVQEFITPVADHSRDYLYPVVRRRIDSINISSPACYQPFKQAVVRGNGDVIICGSHLAANWAMGNLYDEESLGNIFSSRPANDLRQALLDGTFKSKYPICSACIGI